jgi:hypothetical protein
MKKRRGKQKIVSRVSEKECALQKAKGPAVTTLSTPQSDSGHPISVNGV